MAFTKLASKFFKIAKPMANVLFLVADVMSSRKGEFDPSIYNNIKKYKSLLNPADGWFSSRKAKVVQTVFFERSIRDNENFEWLCAVSDRDILSLLKDNAAGKDYSCSDLYNKLSEKFFEGKDVNAERFSLFINCAIGYFSVFICNSAKQREKLSISILGDIEGDMQDASVSVLDIIKNFCDSSDAVISASINSHFKENFKESLLSNAASKLYYIDSEFLKYFFGNRYVFGDSLSENGNKKEIQADFLKYLEDTCADDFAENICNIVNTLGANYKGHIYSCKDIFCKEISFCFALKILSEYDDFILTPQNIYEINESLIIKCLSRDNVEIELIISSITGKSPDFRIENPNILTIGEVGIDKENNEDEYIDVMECALIGRCQERLSSSLYKGATRDNQKINKALTKSSNFDIPLYFYIILEEAVYGEAMANNLGGMFHLLRFIMRSDDDDAIRFSKVETYRDAIDSIEATIN
ncbi:hypothetical protein [Maridesulfovibrio frigidus]|uniref:hypothetical protein n=1 Tax=Maridesulfovibrio frigidus TaxID=340956 RepID=UPI0004E136DB|nr:hypothetical protein [Maridesulfovibrio frigidus]